MTSVIYLSAVGGYIPKSGQPEAYYGEPPYHTVPQVPPPSVSTHRSSIDSWTEPDLADGWTTPDLQSRVHQSPSYCGLQQAASRTDCASATIDIKPAIQAATLAGYSGKSLSGSRCRRRSRRKSCDVKFGLVSKMFRRGLYICLRAVRIVYSGTVVGSQIRNAR